jgi:outer membrane protein assembly factor BamB
VLKGAVLALAGAAAILFSAPGASQPARVSRAGDWPTYHRDNARDGADPLGPALGHVRRLWSAGVDAAVYAEPLVVGGKVIVATENNSVYAFAAASGRRLWRAQLAAPVAGASLPCGNIDPSGITSTPVAAPGAGLVYAVIFVRGPRHLLVALELASGRVRWRRPIDPPGADPRVQQERAALALANGRLYVAYGGLYGDCGNYHGWVVAASLARPGSRLASYRVPASRGAGIWAPSGPAVDAAGNVYVATGNGVSSSFDYGNALIRLTPALRPSSFFAPRNAGALNGSDTDLGSSGPLLLPGARVFVIGKSGVGYLLNANRLGGLGHPLFSRAICEAAFGGLASRGGTIYIPCTSGLVAVRVAGLRELWRNGAASQPPIVAGAGLWAIGGDSLYQFDARSGGVRFQAPIGSSAHFATPAAGGGRIFVVAGGRVQAFG